MLRDTEGSEADLDRLLLLLCTETSSSPRSEDSQPPPSEGTGSNLRLRIVAIAIERILRDLSILEARLDKIFRLPFLMICFPIRTSTIRGEGKVLTQVDHCGWEIKILICSYILCRSAFVKQNIPEAWRWPSSYNARAMSEPRTSKPTLTQLCFYYQTGGKSNILSSIVKQVKDSISTVFAGARRQPAFPRIQVSQQRQTWR